MLTRTTSDRRQARRTTTCWRHGLDPRAIVRRLTRLRAVCKMTSAVDVGRACAVTARSARSCCGTWRTKSRLSLNLRPVALDGSLTACCTISEVTNAVKMNDHSIDWTLILPSLTGSRQRARVTEAFWGCCLCPNTMQCRLACCSARRK